MSAIITIDPLLDSLDAKTFLGGRFLSEAHGYDPKRPVIRARWDNRDPIPSNQAAHDGMMELKRVLEANPGTALEPVDILCWSGGAQVAKKFAREQANGAALPANSVRVWAAGCPESKFTGASVLYPVDTPAVYPGNKPHTAGCPTPLAFHGGYGVGYGLPLTIPACFVEWNEVINQYDGWADAPIVPTNSELTRIYGRIFFIIVQRVWEKTGFFSLLKSGGQGPHGEYQGRRAKTLDNQIVFTDPDQPKVKYRYLPTYPFPSINRASRASATARNLDRQRRPVAETAWSRPVTIPPPDYSAAVPTWFPTS